MPINFYTVSSDLEENGWTLLSDNYKNLQTPLLMTCPKGHKQEQTYGEWRKHKMCDTCFGGDKSGIKHNTEVPPKSFDTYRILALDAASGVSGYSVYDNELLVGFGTYKALGSDATERINDFKKWLIAAIDKWKPDFVGVEHIQLQTFGHNKSPQVEMYRVLANLQGVIKDTLYELNIKNDLIYASEWRKVCNISDSGRENKKKQAQDKVRLWYGVNCTQDEADAICLGKYCIKHYKNSIGFGEEVRL